jgi:hypothetical protein
MANVISAAYRGAANSFLLIAMEMVRLTVRSGNTPASGFAYSCYGIILTGALGDAVAGTALVPVCEAMLDLPMTRPFKSKTLFALGAFVLQWSQHLEVCADRLYQGYKAGLEVGDLEFASHCGYLRSYFRIRAANDLSELAVDLERMVTALRPLGEGRADELCGLYLQAVRSPPRRGRRSARPRRPWLRRPRQPRRELPAPRQARDRRDLQPARRHRLHLRRPRRGPRQRRSDP